MTDEQRKEICKAFYIHKMTVNEIAEAFDFDAEEIGKAIAWGSVQITELYRASIAAAIKKTSRKSSNPPD